MWPILAVAGLSSLVSAAAIRLVASGEPVLQREVGTLTMLGIYFLLLAGAVWLGSQLRQHILRQPK